MRRTLLFGFLALVFVATPALAKGQAVKDVYVPSGETKAGNFYVAADTVEIAGEVESDLIVAAGNVVVSGAVGGDVIAAGGNLRITGPVGGNVRVVGGNVELGGVVERNITLASGTLVLLEGSDVKGHVTAASGTMELRGKVAGKVLAAAGTIVLSGEVQGPLELWLDPSGSLDIRETAITGSSFAYYSKAAARIAEGASLAQAPEHKALPVRSGPPPGWWFGRLLSLFGALVLGMVLATLMPRKVQEVAEHALAQPWQSLGWGALWAVAVPVATVILLITLIGIPLAGVLLGVYIVGLIVSQVMAGAAVGWFLKRRLPDSSLSRLSVLALLMLGITLYRLLGWIPFLGGVVVFLGTLMGWGALIRVQWRTLQSFR